MDIGWGGVPIVIPSDTALKYLNGFQKVLKEKDLPAGAHLRATRIMENIRGFKNCKKDLTESYDNYHHHVKRLIKDSKPMTNSGVRSTKMKAGNEYKFPMDPIFYHNKQCAFGPSNTRCPMFRSNKPGSGLGWTEPRKESFIGLVDRRLTLKGYIGGVKKRESAFADK